MDRTMRGEDNVSVPLVTHLLAVSESTVGPNKMMMLVSMKEKGDNRARSMSASVSRVGNKLALSGYGTSRPF